MSVTSHRAWLRRWRFPIFWTVVLIALGLFVNVYLALRPESVRAVIETQLTRSLPFPIEVGDCSFGLTEGIVVQEFRLRCPHHLEADAPERLLEAPSIRVRPSYGALLMGKFLLREIIVREPRVFLHRDSSGRWNVEGLTSETTGDGPAFDVLRLEGGTVVLDDEYSLGRASTRTLEHVEVLCTRERDGTLHLQADFAAEGVAGAAIEAELEAADGARHGSVRVVARKIDLEQQLRLLGDVGDLAPLRPESLHGFVDAEADFEVTSEGIRLRTVSGSLVGGGAALTTAVASLDQLRCAFRYADGRLDVLDLSAEVDRAHLTGAFELHGLGASGSKPWSASAELSGLSIDAKLLERLPDGVREQVGRFRPSGVVSLGVEIRSQGAFPPSLDDCSVSVQLEGVSARPERLPYEFRGLRGELLVEDGRLTIPTPIHGTVPRLEVAPSGGGETTAQIAGAGMDLVAGGAVDVTVKVQNIPIDDRARSLLPPSGRRVWDQFQLVGTVDGTVTLSRAAAKKGEPPENLRVTATAFSDGGVGMNYVHFPYPITEISGKATYDTATRRLVFVDLKGRHDERVILGDGVVEFRSPARLKIDLHSDEVVVEPDLVAALPEQARRLLADFGVEGRLITDVSIHSTNDRGIEVATDLQIIEGAVQPSQFPYRLELGAGRLKLLGAHTMEFVGVRTPEGYAPSVLFNGGLVTPGDERELSFKFEATNLPFDDKLRQALPPDLRSFAESFGLRGTFEGTIEGEYIFREDDPSHFRLLYHGEGLRSRDAEVDFGLKLRRMIGKGALVGRKEPGKPHYFLGRVMVESALFNRLELTNGEVKFVYGTDHEAIISARSGQAASEHGYVPPPWLVKRLASGRLRNTFQMLVHSSNLYGGTVNGFGYVDAGQRHDLGAHLVAEKLNLGLAAEDIFGVAGTDTEGSVDGTVTFSGRTGELGTLRGKGKGQITDARLVELPLFLGILSLLFGDDSERHYFREVGLDFSIEDGKFVTGTNGIDIRSQAIKLLGSGSMDFRGNLDLRLLPRFFSLKIPGVEQLFAVLKHTLFHVLVRGSLNEPKVALATAAGLVEFDLDVSTDEEKPRLPADQRRRGRGDESEEE